LDADAARLERRALGAEIGCAAAVGIERNRRQPLREQLARLVQLAGEAGGRVRVDVDEAGRNGEPPASMTRAAGALPSRPMSAMRLPRMPRSIASHGLPLPSRIRPLRIRMS
jgi:hypothetical protein